MEHKSLLTVYRAFVVVCSRCGHIATYWSLNATLPVTRVVDQALADGWQGTAHGNICPDCSKTG